MKCLQCDYRYIESEDTKEGVKLVSDGEESFIEISQNVVNGKHNSKYVVTLYGCPKCGTVRMER
jgi:translation elongation factor P/translation initiation factor 5A